MNKFGKMLGRVLSTLLIFSMVLNSVPANASGYTAYEVKQLSCLLYTSPSPRDA